jgi:DNA primase
VASYCAGNLAAWQWPVSVQRLVIFADADRSGREAANTLRARALSAGLRVAVLAPTDPGSDWCDVWAGREAALIDSRNAA